MQQTATRKEKNDTNRRDKSHSTTCRRLERFIIICSAQRNIYMGVVGSCVAYTSTHGRTTLPSKEKKKINKRKEGTLEFFEPLFKY